jgi:protein FrlC
VRFAQSSAVYRNHSLQFAIQDLHDLGYDGIEIWGGRPHMYRHDLDGDMPEIHGLLERLGLEVCNFVPAQFGYPSILCSENEVVRKDSVDYIKAGIDNAVAVGSPSVSLCPGMTLACRDVETGRRQLVRSFRELEEYAAGTGLALLIEPATGHASINGEDYAEILPLCKGVPLHVHLDDNNGDSDAHLIPGKGNVDFGAFFDALAAIDYAGFVSVELGAGYLANPTAACREALAALREMTSP